MHVPRLHDVLQLQRLHDDDDDGVADATWACADHARVARLREQRDGKLGIMHIICIDLLLYD